MGGLMIARIWHGVTEAKKSEEYLDYLNETGVPDYRATQGNRGVYLLRRVERDRAHFLTLSFWDSIDDVKRFADPDRAKYYPPTSGSCSTSSPRSSTTRSRSGRRGRSEDGGGWRGISGPGRWIRRW